MRRENIDSVLGSYEVNQVFKTVNPLTPKVINMQLLSMISYTIQQTGNENTQTYQMEVAIFI